MSGYIKKIVSGGQTGADRGGLDAAIDVGCDHGGWMPAGRLAEDGVVPEKYNLQELFSSSYPHRTEQNVIDSDATLIFSYGIPQAGSALTVSFAKKHQKPYLILDLNSSDSLIIDNILTWLYDELRGSQIILNIAGSRESSAIGIEKRVYNIIKAVLSKQSNIINE